MNKVDSFIQEQSAARKKMNDTKLETTLRSASRKWHDIRARVEFTTSAKGDSAMIKLSDNYWLTIEQAIAFAEWIYEITGRPEMLCKTCNRDGYSPPVSILGVEVCNE